MNQAHCRGNSQAASKEIAVVLSKMSPRAVFIKCQMCARSSDDRYSAAEEEKSKFIDHRGRPVLSDSERLL